jgi:hypothetical protein
LVEPDEKYHIFKDMVGKYHILPSWFSEHFMFDGEENIGLLVCSRNNITKYKYGELIFVI